MLGVKSNRGPVRGAFAEKLREEIAIALKERQAEKAQTQAKASEELKK